MITMVEAPYATDPEWVGVVVEYNAVNSMNANKLPDRHQYKQI
jgi:hypothetical protein